MEDRKNESTSLQTNLKESLSNATGQAPKHIRTRSEVKGIYHTIEADRTQKTIVYDHIHSIGAENNILSDNDKRTNMVLHKWFQTLVVNNSRFPFDIPVNFVLNEFFESILHQRTKLKGHNLNAHMQAFHEWMEREEQKLRQKYWNVTNPGSRPKEIAPSASVSESEQRATDQQLAQSLRDMYGKDIPPSIQKRIDELENNSKTEQT